MIGSRRQVDGKYLLKLSQYQYGYHPLHGKTDSQCLILDVMEKTRFGYYIARVFLG